MKEEKAFRQAIIKVYLEKLGNRKPTKKQCLIMEDVLFNVWLQQPLSWNRHLTSREKEFLYHTMQGKTIKEISTLMKIEIDGVKFHIRTILKKLSCKNIKQAISIAIRYGEITPPSSNYTSV
ncbi:helix-turn-helix transcriptional regulator [Rickettsiella massiliensis]|uniref:helix-turn-helix transcriptional regulator n=1 Tax=Rickettsiella massiliensis TaxID=676517 RepID=UPI000299E5E9|nr:helix-turn-helix domain-containing protein [Rickettsiella massiliensis]